MTAGGGMTSEEGHSAQLSAIEIVEARFPEHAGRVRQLFQRSETFRSMCEDLAAAVETLANVGSLSANVREARREEYASLVDALVAEIGEALSQSKVVILRRWGENKPKRH